MKCIVLEFSSHKCIFITIILFFFFLEDIRRYNIHKMCLKQWIKNAFIKRSIFVPKTPLEHYSYIILLYHLKIIRGKSFFSHSQMKCAFFCETHSYFVLTKHFREANVCKSLAKGTRDYRGGCGDDKVNPFTHVSYASHRQYILFSCTHLYENPRVILTDV